MKTPDKESLLQTCAQLDPNYRDFIDDSQCTPEQTARIATLSQYILNEVDGIRCELLSLTECAEATGK